MFEWKARIKDTHGNYRYDTDLAPMTLEHAQRVVQIRAEDNPDEPYFTIEAILVEK